MPLVKYEKAGRIAYVTLNRPEKLNAINPELRQELYEALVDVRDNPDVWLAIITGEGRAFCTGHDLVAMAAAEGQSGPTTDDLYILEASIWKPILVAINGICLAQGCGIALLADVRIASEEAQFGWPQVKRGISSVSGPVLLAQRIPFGRAMETLFSGEMFSAQEALNLGLVNRVVPRDRLMEETEAMANRFLVNAPLAVRAIKEVAVRGLDLPLEARIRMARQVANQVRLSEDAQEGLAAFQEKRAPVWKGR